MTAEARLKEPGIVLPQVTAPAANYVPYSVTGSLVIVSGQLPMENGKPQFIGQVGDSFTIEEGQECARLCALNCKQRRRAAAVQGMAGYKEK